MDSALRRKDRPVTSVAQLLQDTLHAVPASVLDAPPKPITPISDPLVRPSHLPGSCCCSSEVQGPKWIYIWRGIRLRTISYLMYRSKPASSCTRISTLCQMLLTTTTAS